MPHFVVDCSQGVLRERSEEEILARLHHAVNSTGLFEESDIKVRVKLRFKGRQKAHKEFGFQVVNRFVEALAAYGQADSPPKLLGDRDLNVFLTPLSREKRAKLAGGPPPPAPAPARAGKPSSAPGPGTPDSNGESEDSTT